MFCPTIPVTCLCKRLTFDSFWGVFWVDVSSQSSAKNGFNAVAKALGSSVESIDESRQALANTKRHWLLVLDNADDPDFDYSVYIPSGTRGAIIMTSRIPECSRYSTIDSEALEGLDIYYATRLLLKAANIPEESWPSHEPQAQDVVRLLGSHTLALTQAGAYIAEGHCRLDQYADRYRHQRRRLLDHHPKQEQSRYRGVYATFGASADVLEHSKGRAERAALELLSVLSVLHFSMLPLQVFELAWKGARNIPQAKRTRRFWIMRTKKDEIGWLGQQHIPHFPVFMALPGEKWDGKRLEKATSLLASLSLVTRLRTDGHNGVSMHPLAHAWAKDRLNKEQQQQAWVTAGCVLASLRLEQTAAWRTYEQKLGPHIHSYLSPEVNVLFSYSS